MIIHPDKPLAPIPLTRAACTETTPGHEFCGYCAQCNSPRWYCGHQRITTPKEILPS